MILKAVVLILFGLASIFWAIWTWVAWKKGKSTPLELIGAVKEPRTEIGTVSLAFEVFFEVAIGLLSIGIGWSLLPAMGELL
ncbi:hypothetical protein [Parasphingorhabdus sp.]|uniref:hypothetical protein n=1 Tax=Parasphingorhabdus sp. TaxID=2709688 RepID=UPI003BAE9DA0